MPEASVAEETADAERWTVGKLLTWTTDYLRLKRSDSPRLDAEVLLAHVLGWQRVQLYTHYEEPLGEKPRGDYRNLVRKRAEGMPVAYLVGRKEFFSLTLSVNPDVLIPRPDTETVVVEFLSTFKSRAGVRAVDVGTGSGCITLGCLSQHPTARFVAIDRSPEALNVARSNAERLKLQDRVKFVEGNLLEPLLGQEPFDAILSNPPYIATELIPQLEPGVRDYEPHLALDGGKDGLRMVSGLIEQAPRLLSPDGHLFIEIGSDQEEPVRAAIAEQSEFELFPTVRDAANHPRVLHARKRA